MRKSLLFSSVMLVLLFGLACSLAAAQEAKGPGAGKYTKADVVVFVEKAATYAKANGKEKALKEFMNKNGEFVKGELYIYAYDFNGKVLAHGGQPELVGQVLIGMTDPKGVQVIKELIKLAKQGSGWLEYLWANPAHGNKVEPKAGYVMKVDDTWFLGSGIYEPAKAETAKEAYDKGAQYWKDEKDEQAIAQFKRALEIDPKYIDSYITLGKICLYEKKDPDGALDYANKAVEADPNSPEAHMFRGNVYDYKGNYDMAISEMTKVIELRPDDATTYKERGTIYSTKGDPQRAIADYTKAIELKPDYVNAYVCRAMVYDCMGEAGKSEADYRKADSLSPDK